MPEVSDRFIVVSLSNEVSEAGIFFIEVSKFTAVFLLRLGLLVSAGVVNNFPKNRLRLFFRSHVQRYIYQT